MADIHELTLCSDFTGWDYAECSCGWTSPPCPDQATASEFWGDHRAAQEVELCGEPSPDGTNRCEFVAGHDGGHGVWVAE